MSRYLTPSKIGLLALVSLYSDCIVPSAATIPILSFLVSHLLPIEPLDEDKTTAPYRNFTITIDSFQKATIKLASGIPGRTIWDLLLKKIWEISSFDGLHFFFDTLFLLLDQTGEGPRKTLDDGRVANSKPILLSRVSPLGVFVRRAQLEFTRLQFHDGIILWKSFVQYRAPTLHLWRKRNPTAGMTSFDSNLQEHRLSLNSRLADLVYGDISDNTRKEASVSTDEVEKLLEYQVEQMQSTLNTTRVLKSPLILVAEMGNRLSQSMKDQFQNMVKTGVTVPSLSHYVQYE